MNNSPKSAKDHLTTQQNTEQYFHQTICQGDASHSPKVGGSLSGMCQNVNIIFLFSFGDVIAFLFSRGPTKLKRKRKSVETSAKDSATG